jgi:hypothetical protein
LTKLGTYLVFKRIWNPIDCRGQGHWVKFLGEGDVPRFALPFGFFNLYFIFLEYVEVVDGKVTVCRDSVRGKCTRPMCKYYHIPVELPPAK